MTPYVLSQFPHGSRRIRATSTPSVGVHSYLLLAEKKTQATRTDYRSFASLETTRTLRMKGHATDTPSSLNTLLLRR